MTNKVFMLLLLILVANIAALNYMLFFRKAPAVNNTATVVETPTVETTAAETPAVETTAQQGQQRGMGLGLPAGPYRSSDDQKITYKFRGVEYHGYWFPAKCEKENRPVVMVVHGWRGIRGNILSQAERISRYCLNAFAIDMFGSDSFVATDDYIDVTPAGKVIKPKLETDKDRENVKREVIAMYKNFEVIHERLEAAVKFVLNADDVDTDKIGIMGDNFGGRIALDAALFGFNLKGAIVTQATQGKYNRSRNFRFNYPP